MKRLMLGLLLLAFSILGAENGCQDLDGDGWSSADGDCDDQNAMTYPGGLEFCDGADNDCDSDVDEEPVDAVTFFVDVDGDGYGDSDLSQVSCDVPPGFALQGGDCDDFDGAIHPGAVEVCDGADQDCDGYVDEAGACAADGCKTTGCWRDDFGNLYFIDESTDGGVTGYVDAYGCPDFFIEGYHDEAQTPPVYWYLVNSDPDVGCAQWVVFEFDFSSDCLKLSGSFVNSMGSTGALTIATCDQARMAGPVSGSNIFSQ